MRGLGEDDNLGGPPLPTRNPATYYGPTGGGSLLQRLKGGYAESQQLRDTAAKSPGALAAADAWVSKEVSIWNPNPAKRPVAGIGDYLSSPQTLILVGIAVALAVASK